MAASATDLTVELKGETRSPIDLYCVILRTVNEVVAGFAKDSEARRETVLKSATGIAENTAIGSQTTRPTISIQTTSQELIDLKSAE